MYHLLAYNKAALANTADTDIPAVTDPVFAITNSHFLPQQAVSVLFAYAGSATFKRAKIVTPKTLQVSPVYIEPGNVALLPPSPLGLDDFSRYPFALNALEEIAVQATSGVATTEEFFALLGVGDANPPVPPGDTYCMRGTSTTAAVDAAWTQLSVTWESNLPNGQYAATGLRVESTNAIAARLIFENQVYRPGSVSVAGAGNLQHELFSSGRLGVMGNFVQTRMPIVEVLVDGTDASHEVRLYFVRLR